MFTNTLITEPVRTIKVTKNLVEGLSNNLLNSGWGYGPSRRFSFLRRREKSRKFYLFELLGLTYGLREIEFLLFKNLFSFG